MTLKIAFSVDDVSPTQGYGLLMDNGPLVWLKKLNEEFGCKFTLFCIPILNEEKSNNWIENKNWVKKIMDIKYFEIAQHGYSHKPKELKMGSHEFMGVSEKDIFNRIVMGKKIFEQCGIIVSGFKSPGWFMTPNIYKVLEEAKFDYVADHFIGNRVIKQKNIYRIPFTFSADKIYHDKYDDYIIIHTHINPAGGNMNGWTEQLYTVIRNYLMRIMMSKDVEFITVSELLQEQK